MKKKLVLIAAALAFILSAGMAQKAEAITLGLPDINFDTQFLTGGGLNYSAATGDLTVSGAIMGIKWQDGSITAPGGTVTYSMSLTSVNTNPYVTTGNFGTMGTMGPDLSIVDGSGTTLLTGDFHTASITGVNGTNTGSGTAYFYVTGGTLQSQFTSPCFGNPLCGGMVNLNFNLTSTFGSSMFSYDFSGQTKGDIAPVPEPGTLLLLGSGLLAARIASRKLRKNKAA